MQTIVILALVNAGIEGCSSFSSNPRESLLVPRMTLDEYLSSPVYKTPVLIRDIVSTETSLGHEEVQMQRKIKDKDDGSRSTEIYDITLQDCIEYMMDSCHNDSYFAFCEGLLPGSNADSSKLSERLNDIREAPFSNRENWFDYFPSKIKPTDAIILAGAGATSTLHRDPFEWTGSSFCLEGTKIWRFLPPPPENKGGVTAVDEALQSHRLDSIAWEAEEHNNSKEQVVLSAGWQSDITLYDSVDENFPSGFEWAMLEEEDEEIFRRQMEEESLDLSCIQPSSDALDALDQIAKANDSSDNSSSVSPFLTAIQQQGDLLLIPAHCWHQTYAPVPSVAVASQRCGASIDGANVIRHMLDVASCNKKPPEMLECAEYDEGVGKDIVAKVIEYVTVA
eukprot:CAMPEP_0181118752 /NCGR_PEP_ID=MMETSP1071-20121207/23247_1 /TAXON_ID=35127 /ORGANISM="Thalassiosira sp., Strain NH16" /LENGTH=393 /DNA_ID=CAMNT_0023203275 /DNA_START=189 /DNA_END=1369 /DNA_ORIENTATION=-